MNRHLKKLDRDLIRQRDWDYSALAFGVPAEKREALHNEVIGRYGKEVELITPNPDKPQRKRKKKRPSKKKKNSRKC